MRGLNEQLQAANEELQHSRAHLDAAYAELQTAYERLQIRSSHMSELNEQLRVANAECKARREELAQVNARCRKPWTAWRRAAAHMTELNELLRAANAECSARRHELERLNDELALANRKLRELEDVRAQFTLLTTHELRAPVAAIQSYLKLILEGYVPQNKVRETLEKAERRAMEQLALSRTCSNSAASARQTHAASCSPFRSRSCCASRSSCWRQRQGARHHRRDAHRRRTCRPCWPTRTRSRASGTTW